MPPPFLPQIFSCFHCFIVQFELVKHKFPNQITFHVHLCSLQITQGKTNAQHISTPTTTVTFHDKLAYTKIFQNFWLAQRRRRVVVVIINMKKINNNIWDNKNKVYFYFIISKCPKFLYIIKMPQIFSFSVQKVNHSLLLLVSSQQ